MKIVFNYLTNAVKTLFLPVEPLEEKNGSSQGPIILCPMTYICVVKIIIRQSKEMFNFDEFCEFQI